MGERGPSFWGNIADALIPGDAYRSSGWDRKATIGGITQGVLGLMGGPAGSVLGRMVNNGIQGNGWSPFARNRMGGISQTQLAPQPNFTFDPGVFGRQGLGQPSGWVGPTEGQAPQPGWGAFTPNFTPPQSMFAGGNSNGGARSRSGGWTGDAAQGLFDSLQQQSRWNSSAASFGDFSQRQG